MIFFPRAVFSLAPDNTTIATGYMDIRGISPTSRLTERKLARHHARLVEACVEVSGGGPTEEGRSRGGERKREEKRGGEVRVQSVADFRDTS